MRTKEEYLKGLTKLRKNIYLDGQKIDRDDEALMDSAGVIGVTFDLAHDPETKDLVTATSHITGETINRFTHIHQNVEDLHKKQDMTRMLVQRVSQCIGRCMGVDAMNAVNAVSYEAEKNENRKTDYYKNFLKWLEYVQKNDLVGSCAQTDVKGTA